MITYNGENRELLKLGGKMRKSKTKALSAVILAIAVLVCSCAKEEENENMENTENIETNSFEMLAEIITVDEKTLVNVIEAKYAFGEYLIIIPDDIEITDAKGNKKQRTELAPGQILNITYNGQVMMSYPPQIVARKIEISE